MYWIKRICYPNKNPAKMQHHQKYKNPIQAKTKHTKTNETKTPNIPSAPNHHFKL